MEKAKLERTRPTVSQTLNRRTGSGRSSVEHEFCNNKVVLGKSAATLSINSAN